MMQCHWMKHITWLPSNGIYIEGQQRIMDGNIGILNVVSQQYLSKENLYAKKVCFSLKQNTYL